MLTVRACLPADIHYVNHRGLFAGLLTIRVNSPVGQIMGKISFIGWQKPLQSLLYQ